MDFIKIIVSLLALVWVIRTFIRYDPKLDIVESGKKYILFFWYNKYDSWGDEYCTRKYIKLFEI